MVDEFIFRYIQQIMESGIDVQEDYLEKSS